MPFKDHFSGHADAYARYRPRYPSELTVFLANLPGHAGTAWDAGCGSGQLSIALADRFRRVVATDASPEQLGRAVAHPRIEYRRATAEESGLGSETIDLAVAAQAAHWFDLDAYFGEVRRVGRHGSAIALICYGSMQIDERIDEVIGHFYREALGPYWPPERRLVEDGYRTISFPFDEVPAPALAMEADLDLAALLGYLETWSAVKRLVRRVGSGPLEDLRAELARGWGTGVQSRRVRWPLHVRAGRL